MSSEDDEPSSGERAAIDTSWLDQGVGFHLRSAQVGYQRRFEQAAGGAKLSQIQYSVLCLVGANPGASQIDLAAVVGLDRAGIMAVIDRLELRDLVVRTRSKIDRRRRELHLTEAGQAVLDASRKEVGRIEAELSSFYTPAELATLFALLSRIDV